MAYNREAREARVTDTTSTFVDNMKLPVHQWYRYTAGFSSEWVKDEIKKHLKATGKTTCCVLDPFAGSGTTLLAAGECGVRSYGYETQPFVYRVAMAKLLWETDVDSFIEFAQGVLARAMTRDEAVGEYPAVVGKCYSEANLTEIDRMRRTLEEKADGSPEYWLTWLAFVTILRPSSHAGTATCQYVLPEKVKAKVSGAFDAFNEKVELMASDMRFMQSSGATSDGTLLRHDARDKCELIDGKIDLVLTSPPYANNYDYADATRLEQSILGEVSGWADLQSLIRPGLVRSCTQAVSKERKLTYDYVNDPILSSIADELYVACKDMEAERENHGGKKNYHTMVALYCHDLARVFLSLRHACKEGSDVCFVIGDSAPYGVYCPIDEWLGKLAVAAGFEGYRFEKTRDRNVKWKNRKHRVPLKEGRLWIRG